MKKRSFFVAACLTMGAAMITSCSNDDVIDNINSGVEQGVENAQVLTLSIASSGDGLNTRAGRPLYSNEAAQKIDHVALYFVNTQNNIVLKKLVDWTNATDYSDNRGHGKELEIALKGAQKLGKGATYTVYAVGYSNGSSYKYTPELPTDDNDTFATTGKGSWNKFEVSWNDQTQETDVTKKKYAEEVFAGSTTIEVDKNGYFTLKSKKLAITLHRQVAGMTGYFTNIPVKVNNKLVSSIRLVSVAKNSIAQFGHFYSDFTANNKNELTAAKFIVNGSQPAGKEEGVTYADGTTEAHTIYSIKLADWFVVPTEGGKTLADCDLDGDGFLGYKDVQKYIENKGITVSKPDNYAGIWKNPYATEARFVRGSVFSGQFVIPFEKGKSNTLQLQLLAEDGSILKYWNINAATIHTDKTNPKELWEKTDTDKTKYNIYRNHMYNVGMKAYTNPVEPGKPINPEKPDPESPDTGKEEPEDLSKGQDLIIQVNDNWELIQDMELD